MSLSLDGKNSPRLMQLNTPYTTLFAHTRYDVMR